MSLESLKSFASKLYELLRIQFPLIVVSNPVNFLVNASLWRQSTASGYSMTSRFSAILLLSPPSYILYTLYNIATKCGYCLDISEYK